MFGLIVLVALAPLEAPPHYHAAAAASGMGLVVAVFYSFTGLSLLRKAHFWTGLAGPVQRLVTHARGRAYGFFAAILCQLGIIAALLFPQ